MASAGFVVCAPATEARVARKIANLFTQGSLSKRGGEDSRLQNVQEAVGRQLRSWKDEVQFCCPDGAVSGFAEDLPEVSGDGKVAALVELFLLHSWPFAIDAAALDRASQNKHDVGVAVVCAAGTVLMDGASEL